jgi:hypothetical protein
MSKTFVTAMRSPLQPIMDRFVPRDDRSFVMASQSRLATTPLPSLRAQRGNPCFPSLRAQRGNPPFPSLRAKRGNPPFPSLRAKRGNPPFPSLRAKRGNPPFPSLRAKRVNPHTATNMDRFVPRDDRSFVMASQSRLATTPLPSLRAQRSNPFVPSLRAQRGNPPFPSLRAKRGNPHAATNMDRFVPRDDTYTVIASEAWQSKTPHPQHINTRTLT